ncbi:hypothetical protein J6590_019408 [Homalodisca vitripennis]|nr:hypothetical protein J6590_019408 [Homalodisca vitripennis]
MGVCFNSDDLRSSEFDRLLRSELDESEDEVISSAHGSFVDNSDEDPSWACIESNQLSSTTSGIHFIQSSDSDESDVETDQSSVRNKPRGV